MARRFVIGALGIVTLACLAVTGARSTAISADDAAAMKNGDLVARLENRISALEKRITVLEKQRDRGETKFLAQPFPRVIPGPGDPGLAPPRSFDGAWCYTILIDNNGQTAQMQRPNTQR
jgi:hypothetical protein